MLSWELGLKAVAVYRDNCKVGQPLSTAQEGRHGGAGDADRRADHRDSRFARFQRTTGEYFLTGRTVPWWAICFTVVATETSTLMFIGVPGAAYAGNMAFLQLAAGYVGALSRKALRK